MRGYNVAEQCRLIDELAPQVHALIINPVDHPDVVRRLNTLIDDGIIVITLNNDAPALSRHTYVGSDYLEGGRTAGALLRMIGPEKLNVGVLLGSLSMLGHRQRLDGFRETMGERCNILSIHETEDDDMIAYEQVSQLLKNEPHINALFVISSGASYGASRAVLAAGLAGKVTIIVFDTIPTTIRMMQQGVIQAALYQHPHEQGRRAMQVAFDYLVNGTPPGRDRYIMRNEIRILQNAEN
jgi:LacI family transcriptional regulator